MAKKGLIDPLTRAVWVKPGEGRSWWVRLVFSHGGTLCVRIPKELAKRLGIEKGTYLQLKQEEKIATMEVVHAAAPALEKEE